MSLIVPFQLLELNIISAQDLAPVFRHMKTYAVAWVHPNRKLTTRVDPNGAENPSWNDKFVFRVDETFLYADTSSVVIEIYALHWFRDVHVGTVRILISNLFPPTSRPNYYNNNTQPQPGMRFVALQVRRASGRPQGILNVGASLLDSSMRSMPLYSHMNSSAVGYRDLMGEEDTYDLHNKLLTSPKNTQLTGSKQYPMSSSSKQCQSSITSKPEFRRSKSDISSMVASELRTKMIRPNNKIARSVISSEVSSGPEMKKKCHSTVGSGLSRSTIYSGVEGNSRSSSTFELEIKDTPVDFETLEPQPPKTKFVAMADESVEEENFKPVKRTVKEKLFPNDNGNQGYTYPSPARKVDNYGSPRKIDNYGSPRNNKPAVYGTPLRTSKPNATPMRSNYMPTPMKSHKEFGTPMRSNYMATPMKSRVEFGTPMRSNKAGRPMMTESELGPSPSEVATQMARERINRPIDVESSIISEWSVDESTVEGLRSKLERWQTELPPLYDLGEKSSFNGGESVSVISESVIVPPIPNRSVRHKNAKGKKHTRRHTDSGSGLFSCFSNICGVECSIVCGGGDAEKKPGNANPRIRRSPSMETMSFL